jgi:hypothetical protein
VRYRGVELEVRSVAGRGVGEALIRRVAGWDAEGTEVT